MAYVDGVVFAVPTSNRQKYIDHSSQMADIFKKNGAIRVVDCWGDEVPAGEVTSFPMAVKCGEDETVCFSWIEWPSKEARNEGMAKSMEDMRSSEAMEMPFDGKRMIFGGFEMILEK
ncbi:MAG: DUF1428 domain-containing protein [Rhizobiaceae bacterium]|jgi:uncharacterized protein YbaA (DUF1428 family)|nr:DUF1428 domain-containing protein [Rhizobiaceae bacterium]